MTKHKIGVAWLSKSELGSKFWDHLQGWWHSTQAEMGEWGRRYFSLDGVALNSGVSPVWSCSP